MRPGYLRGAPTRRNNFRGLGYFGKGAIMPPPGPPTGPATFDSGKWVCEGPEPQPEADGFWTCCPEGWKKTPFGTTNPCKGQDDLLKCGPIPEGMDASSVKCCADGRWAIIGEPGTDPCATPGQIAPEDVEILAPEIEIRDEPLISPKLMLVGGAVAITLIGLAFLAR